MRAVYIMLLFALLLQGCGRKGPLVVPQAQPAAQQQPSEQRSSQEPRQ